MLHNAESLREQLAERGFFEGQHFRAVEDHEPFTNLATSGFDRTIALKGLLLSGSSSPNYDATRILNDLPAPDELLSDPAVSAINNALDELCPPREGWMRGTSVPGNVFDGGEISITLSHLEGLSSEE